MIFSVVDSQGKSNIITMALLTDETKETFQTVLEDFLTIHKVAPRVIVTDQDKALSYAIDTKLLKSHHILCHWHLKQNIAKNLGWLNNPKLTFKIYDINMRKQIFQKIYNIINIDSRQKFESETIFLKEPFSGNTQYFQFWLKPMENWPIF